MPETQTPETAADVQTTVETEPDVAGGDGQDGGETFRLPETKAEFDDVVGRVVRHRLRQQERVVTERVSQELAPQIVAEVEAKYAPMVEEYNRLREERQQAEREGMSELDRMKTDLAEATAANETLRREIDTRNREAAAAAEALKQNNLRQTIDAALDAANIPSEVYGPGIFAQLRDVEEVQPEALQTLVETAQQRWATMVGQHGGTIKQVPIGSPGAPPAKPRGDADVEIQDLLDRAAGTGPDAEKANLELERRYGNRTGFC